MPRVPRNPGAGKPPHNGPARGAGAGQWGGPAKGAGTQILFTPETARAAVARRDCPQAQALRDASLAAVLNTYAAVMAREDQPQAQIAAAAKLAERVEGPIESKAAVTMAGRDGGPLVIERRIVRPGDNASN